MSNAYFDSTWKYKSTGVAALMTLGAGESGGFTWSTEASGTADTVVGWSEKMRLTNSGELQIGSYIQGTTTNGYLDLRGDSGATSGVRILDTGRVSIGSTSATAHGAEMLHVNAAGSNSPMLAIRATDSNAAYMQFINSTTGSTATSGLKIGIDGSENGEIWGYGAQVIDIATNNLRRVRVASNAYALGIGTTDVEGWNGNYGAIEFGQSSIMGGRNDDTMYLISNAYYDGTWKYKTTDDAARVLIQGDNQIVFRVASAESGTEDAGVTFVDRFNVGKYGTVYIGDEANANMTAGLTINQGANDDEIFALKSSDIAHGAASFTETDTYFAVRKTSAALGGANLRAFAEDGGASTVFYVQSFGGTADTTKSTSGLGLIDLYATEHDGANSLTNITANGNVLSVRARVGGANTTLFLLDEDGDTWQTGSLTTGAPSGGTAAPWKLGTVAAVSPTSPDRTIEVDINGTTYYLHAKTTND